MIPKHYDVYDRKLRGERLNPLEAFVYHNEPAGSDEREFREQLEALIEFVRSPGFPVESAPTQYRRIDCGGEEPNELRALPAETDEEGLPL